MATIGIRAPLRFHGTPQLIEGLAPFRYADVLGGAAVQVTLPGKESNAPLATNIQTVPAGENFIFVRFDLPSATPAGNYPGEVSLGEARYPIEVEVEGRSQLHLSPRRLSLNAAPASSIVLEMTAANGGNADADIPQVSAFGLFDVHGAERSIADAFRATDKELSEAGDTGQQRLNLLVDRLSQEHGGLVRLQIQEGAGPLRPGEIRNLKLLIRMPESIKPGHAYTATWPIDRLRVAVRVVVPPTTNGKEVK
jgi:hypothetical protein